MSSLANSTQILFFAGTAQSGREKYTSVGRGQAARRDLESSPTPHSSQLTSISDLPLCRRPQGAPTPASSSPQVRDRCQLGAVPRAPVASASASASTRRGARATASSRAGDARPAFWHPIARQTRATAPSCELLASSVRDAASRSGHTRISSVTSSALAACAPGSAPLSSSRRRVGTTPSLEARGRRRSSRRRSLEAPGRRDWGSCGARRCPMAASAVPGSACGSGQRSLSCAVSEQTHLRTRARDAHSCVCRQRWSV